MAKTLTIDDVLGGAAKPKRRSATPAETPTTPPNVMEPVGDPGAAAAAAGFPPAPGDQAGLDDEDEKDAVAQLEEDDDDLDVIHEISGGKWTTDEFMAIFETLHLDYKERQAVRARDSEEWDYKCIGILNDGSQCNQITRAGSTPVRTRTGEIVRCPHPDHRGELTPMEPLI